MAPIPAQRGPARPGPEDRLCAGECEGKRGSVGQRVTEEDCVRVHRQHVVPSLHQALYCAHLWSASDRSRRGIGLAGCSRVGSARDPNSWQTIRCSVWGHARLIYRTDHYAGAIGSIQGGSTPAGGHFLALWWLQWQPRAWIPTGDGPSQQRGTGFHRRPSGADQIRIAIACFSPIAVQPENSAV